MILAISRFRVRDRMSTDVGEEWFRRPGRLDTPPGCLAMETFTDPSDPTLFYLLSRWTDAASLRTWQSGPAQEDPHPGTAPGPKLDPAYTRVVVLDRSEDGRRPPGWEEIVADSAPFLGRHLAKAAGTVHCIVAALDGTIHSCNRSAAEQMGVPADELFGTPIWNRLTGADAERLRLRVQSGKPGSDDGLLLNFVDARQFPYTLECSVDVQPNGFTILGDPPREHEDSLQEQLILMNNQLAVLSREHERKSKALAQTKSKLEDTLRDLQSSYWHLKKIQEVLPVCMGCGRVRTADAGWGEVIEYLRKNALFLSHTYCPPCLERAESEMEAL